MSDQTVPTAKLFCAPAKPKWRWPWSKAKPRAWFTIERAGQRTDDNHHVTLTAHGGAEGEGWAMQSVYTHSDTPSENARLEGLAKTLAKITGYAVYDMRKTPWNYPRDGIAPVGTLPVWFDLGDHVKERVEYRVVNGWWHPDDIGRNDGAPKPPQPEFSIPGYDVAATLDGRYIAIPAPTEPEESNVTVEQQADGKWAVFEGGGFRKAFDHKEAADLFALTLTGSPFDQTRYSEDR